MVCRFVEEPLDVSDGELTSARDSLGYLSFAELNRICRVAESASGENDKRAKKPFS
jgi:hypothetical protein